MYSQIDSIKLFRYFVHQFVQRANRNLKRTEDHLPVLGNVGWVVAVVFHSVPGVQILNHLMSDQIIRSTRSDHRRRCLPRASPSVSSANTAINLFQKPAIFSGLSARTTSLNSKFAFDCFYDKNKIVDNHHSSLSETNEYSKCNCIAFIIGHIFIRLIPLPDSWPVSPDDNSPGIRNRGTELWAPPRKQIIYNKIFAEKKIKVALEKQKFRCAGCGMKMPPKTSKPR